MVKHIILWKLKAEYEGEEKKARILEAKTRLESLNGKIPGLTKLEVLTTSLPSSKADMMLYSEFVDNEALMAYQENPTHIKEATYVRSIVENRLSWDYVD